MAKSDGFRVGFFSVERKARVERRIVQVPLYVRMSLGQLSSSAFGSPLQIRIGEERK